MPGEALTETSVLPAAVFLLPVLAGVIVISATRTSRALQQWISVLTAALVTGLGAWMAYRILGEWCSPPGAVSSASMP